MHYYIICVRKKHTVIRAYKICIITFFHTTIEIIIEYYNPSCHVVPPVKVLYKVYILFLKLLQQYIGTARPRRCTTIAYKEKLLDLCHIIFHCQIYYIIHTHTIICCIRNLIY